MAKYRKKPVVIEAVHCSAALWAASQSWKDLPKWLEVAYEKGEVIFARDHALIRTLEGSMCAEPTDMIICGVNGELYPCKPDIFAKTYELVEE